MNEHEYVVHGSLAMSRGSLLRIDEGPGMIVYVWEGEVWLTQDRDRQDRLLKAGDAFRLDRAGAAIACALKRSVLTLTAPAPEHYADRVRLYASGSSVPRVLYGARGRRIRILARMLARLRRAWSGLFAPNARPTTAAL